MPTLARRAQAAPPRARVPAARGQPRVGERKAWAGSGGVSRCTCSTLPDRAGGRVRTCHTRPGRVTEQATLPRLAHIFRSAGTADVEGLLDSPEWRPAKLQRTSVHLRHLLKVLRWQAVASAIRRLAAAARRAAGRRGVCEGLLWPARPGEWGSATEPSLPSHWPKLSSQPSRCATVTLPAITDAGPSTQLRVDPPPESRYPPGTA